MRTSTDRSTSATSAGMPRRAAALSRRTGLVMGLAAALTAGTALVGASPALAAPPVCGEERAYVHQSTGLGRSVGPNVDSRFNPGEFNISKSADSYVFAAGIHRPRRTIKFTFKNQDDAVVKPYESTVSDNNGIVRQEDNVFKWDFTEVGSRVRIYADIHTRCGGDDVLRNVYVGAINTTP
ncbi:hypothetical protein ITP53_14990 [Nonomuraea sp. K274]|uniref:Uncharacterized protein n=1 Tax=Nonomuraea cypriaca TaxID=1187855 RepID=A0A931ABE9_9ACTN|nr:hypothetical protein [Nonomuraea cypriaca]MBF8187019.1 hypothetical protein [Nonomuraea cypriaca]